MPAVTRPSAELNFIYFDGKEGGFLKSVEGGAVSAEVINEPVGTDFFIKKHIGTPRYEEFILRFGFSISQPIYDWIAASWKGKFSRKNGSIIAADYQYVARSEREFLDALITAVTFPAMDGASKDAAYLTVRLKPETIRAKKGSGQTIGQGGLSKPEQKAWLPSNFRLEIAGLDCKRVNKIDSFTVRSRVSLLLRSVPIVTTRWNPPKLEFPNLKITLSEVDAQSWIDWHNDFVIMGKNSEADEKSGSLVFLSPDRQTELGRVNFFNLGTSSGWRTKPPKPIRSGAWSPNCTVNAWSWSSASSDFVPALGSLYSGWLLLSPRCA